MIFAHFRVEIGEDFRYTPQKQNRPSWLNLVGLLDGFVMSGCCCFFVAVKFTVVKNVSYICARASCPNWSYL